MTTVGTTRMATHHAANDPVVRGRGRRCAVIVAARIDSAMGATTTAPLTSLDKTGRPSHRSSATSVLGPLRSIPRTVATYGVRDTAHSRFGRYEGVEFGLCVSALRP
jgi:hypothetical protein